MTGTMIQRVAEATTGWVLAVEPEGWRVQHGCVVFGKLHVFRHDALADLKERRARAALEAMLEPSEEMVEAGMDYDEREIEIRLGRPPSVEEAQTGEWKAMIHAALHETKDAVGREGE